MAAVATVIIAESSLSPALFHLHLQQSRQSLALLPAGLLRADSYTQRCCRIRDGSPGPRGFAMPQRDEISPQKGELETG